MQLFTALFIIITNLETEDEQSVGTSSMLRSIRGKPTSPSIWRGINLVRPLGKGGRIHH